MGEYEKVEWEDHIPGEKQGTLINKERLDKMQTQFELTKSARSFSSAPVGSKDGDWYFNTTDQRLYLLSNGVWQKMANESELLAHIVDKNNPHTVTKAQVGLGNADNTSDVNKPISIAQQTALNAKADKDSDNRMTNPILSVHSTTRTLDNVIASCPSGGTVTESITHANAGAPFSAPTPSAGQRTIITVTYAAEILVTATVLPTTGGDNVGARIATMIVTVSAGIYTKGTWYEINRGALTLSNLQDAILSVPATGSRAFRMTYAQLGIIDNVMSTQDAVCIITRYSAAKGTAIVHNMQAGVKNNGRIWAATIETNTIGRWVDITGINIDTEIATLVGKTIDDYFLNEMGNSQRRIIYVNEESLDLPMATGTTGGPVTTVPTTVRFTVEIVKFDATRGYAIARRFDKPLTSGAPDTYISLRATTWTKWINEVASRELSSAYEDSTYALNLQALYELTPSNSSRSYRIINGQTDGGNGVSPAATSNDFVVMLTFYKISSTVGAAVITNMRSGRMAVASKLTGTAWGVWRMIMESDIVYPVGAVFMSVNNVNPASVLGFGTWVSNGTLTGTKTVYMWERTA